jgi:hypothetical protein
MFNQNTADHYSKVSGFTGATFDSPSLSDIVIPGAVNTGTDDDFDITNTANLTSFSTKFGTVDTITGARLVDNILTDNIPAGSDNEPPEIDSIRNFWGFESEEIDGGDSSVGLDVSNGIDDAISADVSFDTTLSEEGAPGEDNDIFIVDLLGDDSIVLFPLDEEGNRIGDFKLEINTGKGNFLLDEQGNFVNNVEDLGDWGDTGTDIAATVDFTSGTTLDDANLVGVAFDIGDFQGTGTLDDVAGLRVQGTGVNSGLGSVDLAAIGYNTLAEDIDYDTLAEDPAFL